MQIWENPVKSQTGKAKTGGKATDENIVIDCE